MKKYIWQVSFIQALFATIFVELFKFFVILFLVLYFIESLIPGFVSNNFHFCYVLLAIIVCAIIALIAARGVQLRERSGGWWLIFLWAILFALIIGVKADGIGVWRYVLALAVFVIFVACYKAIVNLKLSDNDN